MKKKKAIKPDLATEQYLSHGDHVALLLADKDAAVAQMKHGRDSARLEAYRTQFATRIAEMEKTVGRSTQEVESACEARHKLATDLAERYAISWEDVALEQHTGRLVKVPSC